MVLGNFCGKIYLIMVGQGPSVLAEGTGGVVWTFICSI